jgi:hypothetical protein
VAPGVTARPARRSRQASGLVAVCHWQWPAGCWWPMLGTVAVCHRVGGGRALPVRRHWKLERPGTQLQVAACEDDSEAQIVKVQVPPPHSPSDPRAVRGRGHWQHHSLRASGTVTGRQPEPQAQTRSRRAPRALWQRARSASVLGAGAGPAGPTPQAPTPAGHAGLSDTQAGRLVRVACQCQWGLLQGTRGPPRWGVAAAAAPGVFKLRLAAPRLGGSGDCAAHSKLKQAARAQAQRL